MPDDVFSKFPTGICEPPSQFADMALSLKPPGVFCSFALGITTAAIWAKNRGKSAFFRDLHNARGQIPSYAWVLMLLNWVCKDFMIGPLLAEFWALQS